MAERFGKKMNEAQRQESEKPPKVYWETTWILKDGAGVIILWTKDVVPENECYSQTFVQFIGFEAKPPFAKEKQVTIWTDEVAAMVSIRHLIFDEVEKKAEHSGTTERRQTDRVRGFGGHGTLASGAGTRRKRIKFKTPNVSGESEVGF